jgi:acetaldehyde dehydrogenase/alcohol dehydrogenase
MINYLMQNNIMDDWSGFMLNHDKEVEKLKNLIEKVKKAQKGYALFSQNKIDDVFKSAAFSANKNRISLAKYAFSETGMGVIEDKVIKNSFASEYIYNHYRNTKTIGILEENEIQGTKKIAEPIGLIGAVIPTTNPTSTVIFKALIALKTGNGIIFSPHPRATKSTIEAARIIYEAAIAAGAPENIIAWIDVPSLELTNILMSESDIILATGGPAMVKAAYSSGKPAIGVGPGNTPVIIDESADIESAVSSIIHSKTFDNGMICASEQSVIVIESIYEKVRDEFLKRECYFLDSDWLEKVRKTIIINGVLNALIVGQSAEKIASISGINVPKTTKILIGEVESTDPNIEEFSHEKLCPVLAMYKANTFDEALNIADSLIKHGGYGHTSSIYINQKSEKERLEKFSKKMKTCRILVNTPSSHGAIGDLYNFGLTPSLTLGCGSWGGNSVFENVGIKHLINIKTVAERRSNMLWFRTPEKIYIKKGCLQTALKELSVLNKEKVFIVTDKFLFSNGYTKYITDELNKMEINHMTFYDVEPDPTLECAKLGAKQMESFEPDCIIAIGGGSAMDAGKIMWFLYEHPNSNFHDMAMRFIDIRKRLYTFPKMGEKAYFIAIPTSSGTGSEVTPFAVITDEKTGIKYPLADYELMPKMAIIDANLMMDAPKNLTAASGIDALVHALEAYVSMLATDYTDSLALRSIKLCFEFLPLAYENGENIIAREKMADAATIAGMAFANAFLGVCHSMAHKLGAFYHLPHGIANALMLTEVIKFNCAETGAKMGTFPQYEYPCAIFKYAEIADYLNIKGSNEQEKINGLISKIDELKEKIGIKKSIKDYGIDEIEFLTRLDNLSEQAFDDQCTGANPRYPAISEIKDMYLKAFNE